MKAEITAWLSSPRNYKEGVALFEKYGTNPILKRKFSLHQTPLFKDVLLNELIKLAELTLEEANKLPRMSRKLQRESTTIAQDIVQTTKIPSEPLPIDMQLLELARTFGVTVDNMFQDNVKLDVTDAQRSIIEEIKPKYIALPEYIKKSINIRENYPFLSEEDCPNEMKILVADMFTAYDNYRDAYMQITEENSQEENMKLAGEVIDNFLNNRSMWAELDYYKENGHILGEHPIFLNLNMKAEIAKLSDIQLQKRIANARANISKWKGKAENADEDKTAIAQEKYDYWLMYYELICKEIDSRTK